MNGEVQDFVEMCVNTYPEMRGRVLEVGSRDICGSARRWFTKDGQQLEPTERFPQYVGIDIVQGNLVDKIMNAHAMTFHSETFGVVVSTSSLEHDDAFWFTMFEINRVLTPGGYLILSVPGWRGCGPHCEHDYWRFMPEGVEKLLEMVGLIKVLLEYQDTGNDILCLARKPERME